MLPKPQDVPISLITSGLPIGQALHPHALAALQAAAPERRALTQADVYLGTRRVKRIRGVLLRRTVVLTGLPRAALQGHGRRLAARRRAAARAARAQGLPLRRDGCRLTAGAPRPEPSSGDRSSADPADRADRAGAVLRRSARARAASAAPDLVVAISAAPDPAVPGDTLTVKVTAANLGDTAATAPTSGS